MYTFYDIFLHNFPFRKFTILRRSEKALFLQKKSQEHLFPVSYLIAADKRTGFQLFVFCCKTFFKVVHPSGKQCRICGQSATCLPHTDSAIPPVSVDLLEVFRHRLFGTPEFHSLSFRTCDTLRLSD